MRKCIILAAVLGTSILTAGCGVFEGRPKKNNIDQARGSYVWMTERLNEEQDADQLEGQFGNQSNADANDARPSAIDIDGATFPVIGRK